MQIASGVYLPFRSKTNMKGFCGPGGIDCNGDGLPSAVAALTHISSLLGACQGRRETENNGRIWSRRRTIIFRVLQSLKLINWKGFLKAFKSPWHRSLRNISVFFMICFSETQKKQPNCRDWTASIVQASVGFERSRNVGKLQRVSLLSSVQGDT